MPPRSSSSTPAVDPIELLSQQIEPIVKRKGNTIKLASDLAKAVKFELQTVRTSKKYVSDIVVAAIVSTLDEHDGTCSRFDPASFAIILQTLLQAQYSRQKERGIILLTASLHHDAHQTPPLKNIRARKTAIGKETVLPLLSYFTNTLENPRIRRWAGVLLLQLLEGCDPNRVVFEAGPEDSKRMLGTMVLEEQNEILKITCGQLLRALLTWGIPRENLWPVSTNSTHYERFPVSSQTEKSWNVAFQEYIDEIFDSSIPSQSSGTLYFAQALVISPKGSLITKGIINILVDRDISIYTESSGTSFTESLEIPRQLIAGVMLEDTLLEGVTSSKASAVDVIVELKASSELSCYINAVPVTIHGLRITVKDENVANDLGGDFTIQKPAQKASQSQATIAIANGFYDALHIGGNEVEDDCNKDLAKSHLDLDVLQLGEETHDDGQYVEFHKFVEESQQQTHIGETGSEVKHGIRGPPEDIGSIAERICRNNQGEADNRLPLHSSAPARLPSHNESAKRDVVDIENNQQNDDNIDDPPLKRNLRRKAPLLRAVPETTVPEPSSDQYFGGIVKPVASPVVSPVAPTQPKVKPGKSKPSRSKARPALKVKKAAKPKSSNEEIQKVKKYSLGRKPEAPIVKATVIKRASTSKISGPQSPLSKGGLKVPALKPGPSPKAALVLGAKTSKKKTLKTLIPKKPVVRDIPKRPIQESQANLPELFFKPGMQVSPVGPPERVTKTSGLDTQGQLAQESLSTDRRASRLAEALADIDNTHQHDASSEELIETNLVYQPSQVISRTGSLSSPIIARSTPVLADLPEEVSLEGLHNIEKNESPSSHVGVPSESSPSSLERVSPVPLPAKEASPVELYISGAPFVPSKVIYGPVDPRQSSRLAPQCSRREASVALSRVRAKVLYSGEKSLVTYHSNVRQSQQDVASWDDNTPLRADEFSLFDDHLARKTPLISFGAKGPRNQGMGSSNKTSLQKIKRKHIEELKPRLMPTQAYARKQFSKRKRDIENDLLIESNKRQQTFGLRRPEERPFIARTAQVIVRPGVEDHIVRGNHLAARKTARLGSQGSRVNENGSPRGNSKSAEEQIIYKAIAREVMMDKNATVRNDDNNGTFLRNDDGEGLNVVQSDQRFVFALPTTSSTSFKVRSLSPRPDGEVIKPYLPRLHVTDVEYRKVEKKLAHHEQEKPADPFLKESPEKDLSAFARRLQYRRHTPIHKERKTPPSRLSRNKKYNMSEDPEATLVNVENEKQVEEYSSSSDITTESSGEEQDKGVRKTAIHTEQVQSEEWRMALRPHQKGILDTLNQVSTDLVRYLISHEQAVDDVLSEYEDGGTLLVKALEKTHQDERRRIQHEIDKIKKTMINEYSEARLEISRINKAAQARPVRELEKEWMQEQDQMQRLIEEGMKACK